MFMAEMLTNRHNKQNTVKYNNNQRKNTIKVMNEHRSISKIFPFRSHFSNNVY